MANTVDKVLAVAKAEVGYLEKRNGFNLYDKTANAGSANYTKYGYEMHKIYPQVMDYPAYWCDQFIDWCFYKAYGVSNAKKLLGGNFDDYTVNSAQLYKNKGAYHKSNPKPGDQIFFNNGSRICHTGLVYAVDSSKVYTIEGNTSGGSTVVANGGGVSKKSYPLNYKRIDGYGRPKYDTTTTTSTAKSSSSSSKKSITEIAKEVLDGKWGSGDDRKNKLEKAGYNYKEIQNKVNELSKKSSSNKDTSSKKSITEIAKEVLDGKWGSGDDRKNKLEKAGYNYKEIQNKVNELSKK